MRQTTQESAGDEIYDALKTRKLQNTSQFSKKSNVGFYSRDDEVVESLKQSIKTVKLEPIDESKFHQRSNLSSDRKALVDGSKVENSNLHKSQSTFRLNSRPGSNISDVQRKNQIDRPGKKLMSQSTTEFKFNTEGIESENHIPGK